MPLVDDLERFEFWIGSSHGEFCCLPCCDASGHLDEIGDAVLIKDAGGDGGTVASCAVDRDTAVAWDFVDALLEVG